jgi:large subunit ribosomal protein L15
MKLKKRTKKTRIRGAKTCGYGFRQKHKGHGNKGGFGMAGTGKRADHTKQKALNLAIEKGFKTYFGKQGLTSAKTQRKINKVLNLDHIQKNFDISKDVQLGKYKILGTGEGFKGKIICKSASESAIEKMKKAGGEIIFEGNKSKEVKEEKPVEKKKEESKKGKSSNGKSLK